MTAINIRPLMPTSSAGSTAAFTSAMPFYVGGGSGTANSTKRWLIDVIEVAFNEASTAHIVSLQFNQGASVSSDAVNIWPSVSNFTNLSIDLASRYPRAAEGEGNDTIFVTVDTDGAATCSATLYVIESDV